MSSKAEQNTLIDQLPVSYPTRSYQLSSQQLGTVNATFQWG